MLEINNIEVNELIEKELLDKYYNNIERIEVLKAKERVLLKELEIKNYKNKKEINEIQKENKNIKLMIENILLAIDKSNIKVYDSDITLNKKYKICARSNKKDKLIQYIKEYDLPIATWSKNDYDREDLIKYLNSSEYSESYHSLTKEIESFIKIKEEISISLNKINGVLKNYE